MKKTLLTLLMLSCAMPNLVWAEDIADDKVIFQSDPVYKKLAEEDSHPMDEMVALAAKNNARAQFILGDLYSKGKGGLPLDLEKAREYFEASAIHGYMFSLVRLAALAKRDNKPLEAWKWYTIALRHLPHGDKRMHAVKSRTKLAKEVKLSEGDKRSVSKEIYDWDDKRKEILRLERLEAYEAKKKAAKLKEEAEKKTKKNIEELEENKENSDVIPSEGEKTSNDKEAKEEVKEEPKKKEAQKTEAQKTEAQKTEAKEEVKKPAPATGKSYKKAAEETLTEE